jgi:hypothetical protein
MKNVVKFQNLVIVDIIKECNNLSNDLQLTQKECASFFKEKIKLIK